MHQEMSRPFAGRPADWKVNRVFLQSRGKDVVIASAAKQSSTRGNGDCLVDQLLAMTRAAKGPSINEFSQASLQKHCGGELGSKVLWSIVSKCGRPR